MAQAVCHAKGLLALSAWPHRLDELWKVADAARTVKQTVFGMDMQMSE